MAKSIDYEYYLKRLIVLNARGCYLTFADGHTWIEEDLECQTGRLVSNALKAGGVSLNNKIYGGVFEAIDTLDAALQAAGEDALLLQFWMDFGDGGADKSRIETNVPAAYAGII